MSDIQVPSNEVVAALRELVRLKDLKTDAEAINTSGDWNAVHRQHAMLTEHDAKKGAAWDAARRALYRYDGSAHETSGKRRPSGEHLETPAAERDWWRDYALELEERRPKETSEALKPVVECTKCGRTFLTYEVGLDHVELCEHSAPNGKGD